MARIKNSPQAIVKYVMRSRIPGTENATGLYTRVFFDLKTTKIGDTYHNRIVLADKPIQKDKALAFIKAHGYERLLRNIDGEVWCDPDDSFRAFAKQNKVDVPNNLGLTTICEKTSYEEE